MFDETEPTPVCFESGWFGEVGNVVQDLVAKLYNVGCNPDCGKLHLHLAELELLTVEGYTVVSTQFEIVKGVVEVALDALVVIFSALFV